MQLKRIHHLFIEFKAYLGSPKALDPLFLWESQQIFQKHWDSEAPDVGVMYDASIDSPVTRRLWSRENHAPKLMMLEFAAIEPEMVRLAFRDLFDESKHIEVRLDRFAFYCDELLRAYKTRNMRPTFNRHFHDDNYATISLYLAFRYPDRYAPYDHDAFAAMLRRLGSPDIPTGNDPARYFKVARTLFTLMKKDEELSALHALRLNAAKHYAGDSLLLAHEFCLWSAK